MLTQLHLGIAPPQENTVHLTLGLPFDQCQRGIVFIFHSVILSSLTKTAEAHWQWVLCGFSMLAAPACYGRQSHTGQMHVAPAAEAAHFVNPVACAACCQEP